MAIIASKIAQIRQAIFGKDVRESLASGLEAVNDEVESTTSKQEHLEDTFNQLVINAGNSNAEIVDARVDNTTGKSYDKVGDRLDEVSAYMEDKVNKGQVAVTDIDKNKGKFDQTYMTPEFLQQMAGNTPVNAIPDNLSIVNKQLTKKSISIDKTDYIKISKNLFNKDDVIENKYPDGTQGGILADNTLYCASNFIVLEPNTEYHRKQNKYVCFYDVNGNFISYVNNVYSFTTPSNVYFGRLAVLKSGKDTEQLEKGNAETTYVPYGLYIDKLKVETNNIGFPLPTFTRTVNLFDKTKATTGYYIRSTDGVPIANVNYNASDFIEIKSAIQYTRNYSHQLAFYDELKNYISGIDSLQSTTVPVTTTFTTPSNAKYCRTTVATFMMESFQLQEGSSLTDIEPFGYKSSELYVKNNNISVKDDFLLFLPSEICIAVGRTIELYNKQVCWCGNIDNYHFQWICNVGKAKKRKWSCTAVTGMIGNYSLTLNVYDNNMNLISTATTTIKIIQNTISAPLKVLAIGDSLTNGKEWLAEVRNLSGNNISFVGTRWNGDVQGGYINHEGRSGWSASSYLTNSTYTFENNGVGSENPFWNPSTSQFDYAYYKSHYFINPDVIQIFLGTNGISLDPAVNVTNIKTIVDKIRTVDSSIKIYVVFTLYRGDQDGIGNQLSTDGYSAGSGIWKLQEDRKVYNLMVALNEALKNYTNLFFTPVALTHDSEYNFKATSTTPVNPRSSIAELQDVEATHPSARPDGYLQMADCIFSTICVHQ